MSTKNIPSIKQRRIVHGKIKGLKNTEIGKQEYPKDKPISQRQLVSRELKKPAVAQYLEQSKLIALKESNITWRRVTDAISRGLDDDNKYLSAAKQASDLLDMPRDTKDEELNQALKSLPSNVDEIRLIQLMKSKTS
jgi:hypothetical protein